MRRSLAVALVLLLACLALWRFGALRPSSEPPDSQLASGAGSAARAMNQKTARAGTPAPASSAPDPFAGGNSGSDPIPGSPDADEYPHGHGTELSLQAPLRRLLASQNPDGSWGGIGEDFEGARYSRHSATALALLAFLGTGYTHLSRYSVVVEGVEKNIGEAVKSGMKWLGRNPEEGPFDTALVSLMWGEAYAMTASAPLKELTERSYARLWELQDEAGSWGGEPCTSAWAARALKAAEASGLEIPGAVRERAVEWFARRIESDPSPQDAAAWVLLNAGGDGEALARARASIEAHPPDWAQRDSGYLYRATEALLKIGASDGTASARWCEALEAIVKRYSADGTTGSGSGHGTAAVVGASMEQLTWETYLRYCRARESKEE